MDSSITPSGSATPEPELRDPPAARPSGPSWGVVLLGAAVAVALSLILFSVGAVSASSGLALAAWLTFSHGLAFWAGSRAGITAQRRQRGTQSTAARNGDAMAARLRPLPMPLYRYAPRRTSMFRLFGHRY